MSSAAQTPPVLERDAELAALEQLAARAAAGEGAVALVEGPAGIGKSALLRAGREAAVARGLLPLAAIGSELDRAFPFGLVHQLLDGVLAGAAGDPARRRRLLAGSARHAELVLRPGPSRAAPVAAVEDPTHTVLHGLFWLCANLAEERPVVLVADDLHWSDRASMRFLEFLGRRLDGLPVLLLAGARAGEPGAPEELLRALRDGPSARVLRPAPLSGEAVERLVDASFGADAEPAFAHALHAATRGNPLLLRELTREAQAAGLAGRAVEAARIGAIGAEGVGAAVRRRLATLGPDATAVARAAALLGERARRDDLAALAGLEPERAAAALDTLVRAEVLEASRRGFVHPLVREAVAAAVGGPERARLHDAAARRLAARGAPTAEIALHLLESEPAGDPWVAETLVAAAGAAAAEGAPEAAVTQLRRALREPPPALRRPALLLALGELEAAVGDPAAAERLDAALDGGLTGDEAARAGAARARLLLLTEPQRALDVLEASLADAQDPTLSVRIESMLLDATFYDRTLAPRRPAQLARGHAAGAEPVDPPATGDPPATASVALLAHLAIEAAYTDGHRDEVAALGARALALDPARALGPSSGTVDLLALALRHAEAPELAARLLDACDAEMRRTGARFARFYVNHAWAYWHEVYGSLTAAEAHAREGLAVAREARLVAAELAMVAIAVEILVERGLLAEASELSERFGDPAAARGFVAEPDLLSARALVRRQQGRHDDAEADLRRAHEALLARGWHVPLKGRVALRLAQALHERGAAGQAAALVAAEVEDARRRGGIGTLGMALRVRAMTEPAAAALATLREAEAALAASAMRRDHGWALLDLAAALRGAGDRAAARDAARAALDLAHRVGAERLAGLAREQLAAAGALVQREVLSGVRALTPSERRVAELAASGLNNREIAETLWVTRKTVEMHLGRTYAKLGTNERGRLAELLAGG